MDTWKIGPYEFRSRLLLGTGKFADLETQGKAVEVSEAEILTFAIRRLNLENPHEPNFLEQLDLKKFTLLPNTAGAYTAEEAVRIARLAKASGLCDMIKVEVIGDPKTLLPDPIGTLEASKILVEEGFIVLTYTNDDPILARRLQEAGVHAVMPGASPIGSGQGIVHENNLRFIIEDAKVPIIVDAGIGATSGLRKSHGAGRGWRAFKYSSSAGRQSGADGRSDEAGRGSGTQRLFGRTHREKRYASASSPTEGMIE